MMELNDRQRQAVQAPGTVTISAGAGTGKTQTMAARYLAHIEAGMRPLEVVAVTFTIRAASELRRRIVEQLRERLDSNDPRVLEVEVAPIGTIDSLCQRICAEFPIESGLDYDFAVVDETTYQQFLTQELPHLLEAVSQSTYALIDYSALKALVTSFLADLERFRRAMAVDINAIKADINVARRHVIMTGPLASFADQLSEYTPLPVQDQIADVHKTALHAIASVLAGDDSGFARLKSLNLRGGSAKHWAPGEFELVKEVLRSLRDYVRSLPLYVTDGFNETDERHQLTLEAIAEAVELVAQQLVELKRIRRIADFNDLEIHALRALEDRGVRDELATRFRAILVDEVQDISPLQYEILERLATTATLAAVGDVKQSLYRFRGAEPALFAQQINQSTMHVTLEDNYRTIPGLVSFVNTTFVDLVEPYEPLYAKRTQTYERRPVEVLAIDETSAATMPVRRRALAQQIGHRVLGILEEPFLVVDPRTGDARQARPHDIAIIASRWATLDGVAEELQRLGLVANIVGGGQLLATQEAWDVLTLLSFLDNPHEDLACIALMRSPMVGISDRELATLANTKERSTSWFAHLLSELADDPRLNPLRTLPFSPTPLSPSDQLAKAGDLLLYPELLARLNHDERRRADWVALLDLVDQRANEGFDTRSIVSYLRTALAEQSRIQRPPIEAQDAISLVTIHASKGLEWPITFVIDLDHSPAHQPRQLIDPQRGVAFTLADETSGHLSWIQEHQVEEDLLEERRKWYVATTRARDHLILGFASRSQVDELLSRIEAQFEITTCPIDAPPANPRVAPQSTKRSYRQAPVELTAPCTTIHRTLTSRALNDFRLCPLLLTSADPPFGPARLLNRLLCQRTVEGIPIDEHDLAWMGATEARNLLNDVGGYPETLTPYLANRPVLCQGASPVGTWSISWGPFLDDGTSLIDVTMDQGDLVGLALATVEHPGVGAAIFNPVTSHLHSLTPAELRRMSATLAPLVRELDAHQLGPRDHRGNVCRSCRARNTCHWVER